MRSELANIEKLPCPRRLSTSDSAPLDSCARLRALEQRFFAVDRCSPAGLAAAQLRLLFLRRQSGIPVGGDELVQAHSNLRRFLEAEA